jgi:hypothetical protein
MLDQSTLLDFLALVDTKLYLHVNAPKTRLTHLHPMLKADGQNAPNAKKKGNGRVYSRIPANLGTIRNLRWRTKLGLVLILFIAAR